MKNYTTKIRDLQAGETMTDDLVSLNEGNPMQADLDRMALDVHELVVREVKERMEQEGYDPILISTCVRVTVDGKVTHVPKTGGRG